MFRQADRFGAEGLGEGIVGGFSDDSDDRFGVARPDLDPAVGPVETEAVSFRRRGRGVGRAQGRAGAIDSFARAVAFAISQPDDMDVNEILFRPTRQVY